MLPEWTELKQFPQPYGHHGSNDFDPRPLQSKGEQNIPPHCVCDHFVLQIFPRCQFYLQAECRDVQLFYLMFLVVG